MVEKMGEVGEVGEVGEMGELGEVVEAWAALVPGVVGCGVSLLACDFCHHFLGSYNRTVTPRVCQGGCTAAVVGACTAPILTSLARLARG